MTVRTVLALRALGLGDALTGVPALRGLRRAYPDARLVLAAPSSTGEWLRRLGVVDLCLDTSGLAPLRLPAGVRPDVAVNLHGRGPESHRLLHSTRPGRLVAFRNSEAGHDEGPVWPARAHEVDRWCRLVLSAGGFCGREDLRLRGSRVKPVLGGQVLVHPGAASGSRRWPAERWREVAERLAVAGASVVVTGGRGEEELCAEVAGSHHRVRSRAGEFTLDQLAGSVLGAALLVCGDTGVAHLATALGTPSVLLFGPTPPERWGPAVDTALHQVLWPAEPGHEGDPHGTDVDPVLARIMPDDVVEAAAGLLRHPPVSDRG